jgi:tRNA(Ile)-lysidine synthase
VPKNSSKPLAITSLLLDRSLLRTGDRVVVAVSGGADSVALLRALAAQTTLGIGLAVAHIHHGLRGADADVDEQFVRDLAARLDLPLHLHRVDIPARVARTGESIEAAARTERYAYLNQLIADGTADTVATAHTADDQTETVLMKLLRGAWTAGLGGIHPVLAIESANGRRGRIIRPLLGTRRSAVETYLQILGQSWREDATNLDPAFTRNRMRHALLPLLREENPSLDRTLAQTAQLAREEEARWTAELARLLPQLLLPGKPVRGGGRAVGTAVGEAIYAIELERLRPLDPALRRRVIRAAAERLGVSLSFDETARLLALCGFATDSTVPSKPGSTLQLAHNLIAERTARELRLFRNTCSTERP